MNLRSLLSSIFGKCSKGHQWNITGICYRCGARCRHTAWVGKGLEGLRCIDCGMVAEPPDIKPASRSN